MNARGRPVATPEDVADRVHSLAIRLLRRLRSEDVKAGLTGPRLSALSVVVFGGPITLGDLAAAEQVRPPTMTRLVRALEAEGLVRRERDPADGRVVRVRATPKGETLLSEGRTRRVRRLAESIGRLTASERASLRRATEILDKVASALAYPNRGGT